MCYLELYGLISKYIRMFQLSLLLIFSFIPMWFENILCLISTLSNFFKVCFMTQKVIYLAEHSMWTGKKCIFCYCWMRWSINIIRSSWLMVPLRATMCLPNFCLLDVSITEKRDLKFPIIIVDLSISHWTYLKFCLMYFHALFACS